MGDWFGGGGGCGGGGGGGGASFGAAKKGEGGGLPFFFVCTPPPFPFPPLPSHVRNSLERFTSPPREEPVESFVSYLYNCLMK